MFRQLESLNRPTGVVLLSGLVLFVALAFGQARAQAVRSLSVENGKVYVDGRQVAPERLPTSFDPSGLTLHVQFVGQADPVVEVHGRMYRLENGGLAEIPRAVAAGQGAESPLLPGPEVRLAMPEPQMQAMSFLFTAQPLQMESSPALPAQELLEQQARELQRLSSRLAESRLAEGIPAAFPAPVSLGSGMKLRYPGHDIDPLQSFTVPEILHYQAERAAQAAKQLPQLEIKNYLHDIRRSNDKLYERLLKEQQLEQESLVLAARVRSLTTDAERAQGQQELRDKLEQIFRLKQENRRREIEQLKSQLDDLQQRLDERERLHDQIVDKRLQELVNPDSSNQ